MLQSLLAPLLAIAHPLLVPAFAAWGVPVTWIEVAAFAVSLWMVVCEMRVHPLAWPLAMLSSLAYALLFADSKLYGEASLQLFFVAMSLWGWWQWLRGRGDDGAVLVVHALTTRKAAAASAATLLAWPLVAWLLMRFTDSTVPWLDALPTVGSVLGTWLMGRKFIESWWTWIAVNAFSVALFGYKQLWLTVILYALFTALSWAGLRSWRGLRGHVDARS
ncbi:MAG TPA: nicotinamide riboside transporter PnuC [Burkholderiaceae bacterium]|jgi:nicotinamide mononucleotide transporter|nr:nicotinamide riboside transporter PnuC [Burkholderiaceae bacterium]